MEMFCYTVKNGLLYIIPQEVLHRSYHIIPSIAMTMCPYIVMLHPCIPIYGRVAMVMEGYYMMCNTPWGII
jgi:hypothetical protein